jgi:hypothetical protein
MNTDQAEKIETPFIPSKHNHLGDPHLPDAFFFTLPPPEIGGIYTSHTNDMFGEKQKLAWLGKIGKGALLGSCLGFFISYKSDTPYYITMPIGSLLGVGLSALMGKPNPVCTFVGERGIARVVRTSKDEKGDKGEMFLFSSQTSVATEQIRRFVNGSYVGTSFTYTFYDAEAGKQFLIKGEHKSLEGNAIPADSQWHFGNQAEIALLNVLFPLAQKRLAQGEDQAFVLKDKRSITLQAGALVVVQGNKTHTIPYQDLENIELTQGELSIKEKGGRSGFLGIGQKGVFSFSYSQMPNAKLFFALLQKKIHEANQNTHQNHQNK